MRAAAVLAVAAPALTPVVRLPGPVRAEFQNPPVDSATLERAARLRRAARALARIWPGFWPEDQPFALTAPAHGRILLVWPGGGRPDGYTPVPDADLPRTLAGQLFVRTGFDPMLRATGGFSPALEVGGRVLPAVPDRHFGTVLRPDALHGYAFLVHEFFHTYQERHLPRLGVQPDSARGIGAGAGAYSVTPARIAGAEFRRAVEAERRLLIAALRAPTRNAARAMARTYLALRHRRTDTMPDVRAVEDGYEGSEGSATVVGYEAALAVLGRPRRELVDVVRRRWLEVPLDSLPDGPERDARVMRWRLYGTGAGIALVLERLGIDWKRALAGGEPSLAALLDHAVVTRTARRPARPASTRSSSTQSSP
jgi:hypothetical protein